MSKFALTHLRALEAESISARVIDMYSIKPLDREAIQRAASETGAIVVAEEHLADAGLGVRVAQVVAESHPCPMEFRFQTMVSTGGMARSGR